MTTHTMKTRSGSFRCSGPAIFLATLCAFLGTVFLLLAAVPVGLVFWVAGAAAYVPCLLMSKAQKKHRQPF